MFVLPAGKGQFEYIVGESWDVISFPWFAMKSCLRSSAAQELQRDQQLDRNATSGGCCAIVGSRIRTDARLGSSAGLRDPLEFRLAFAANALPNAAAELELG